MMFYSKRFIAFVTSVALFVVMVYTTNYTPLELSGAISMVVGVYLGAQTIRGSSKE